jgi:hypothetical protein
MALTASSIIQRATDIILDQEGVRWTVQELVRWLNDGQREIVLHKADSNPVTATGTLAAGTRQTLSTMTGISSSNPAKLVNITRNMASGGTKRAVRLISREILDAQTPDWHNKTAATDVLFYVYDERDPLEFFVYPPPIAGTTQLEIKFSAYPTDIGAPSGQDYTSVNGNVSVKDIYGNALLDYILYRAYSKDADYAGNAGRAAAHYQAFALSIGIDGAQTFKVSPSQKVTYNPNAVKTAAPAA